MSDLECKVCGGGGVLTVPDSNGESASEQACPDPVHDGTVTTTPGQALAVDVNDLPVTPAAAKLYQLCSAWERQALCIPWMLGEKDPRAKALQDCAIKLRAAVNDLRRDGEL